MLAKKSHIVYILMLSLLFSCKTDKHCVGYVDNYPITISEMHYWMLLNKAEVHRHFYLEYGVNDSEDFWQSEYGGESPLEMLKNIAFQKAKRLKVQQVLAYEYGLINEINFDSIVSRIDNVNLVRNDNLNNGKIIYGSKYYTQRSYFVYQSDQMTQVLKEKLAEKELKPKKKELEQLLPKSDVSYEDYKDFLRMQYVEQHYDEFIDNKCKISHVKLNKKVWNSIRL